jgi:hypothetical protein
MSAGASGPAHAIGRGGTYSRWRASLHKEGTTGPVQAQLDAFNNRDLDAFLVCYAPDVVIEGPDGAPMMHGHDEMRAMYGQLFAQSPALHCEVPSRIRVGQYAIDEEHTTGFVFAGFPEELHAAVVCRLENDRIAWMRLLM